MKFKKVLIISLIISGIISGWIIVLTNQDISPYKYEIKYVENPVVIRNMIFQDTVLYRKLLIYAGNNNESIEQVVVTAVKKCNRTRARILKTCFYKSRSAAKKKQICHNQYINYMCLDSLKRYYK